MILMQHQEDNYIPQTMIIYVNPLDPSRPLQYGTIPQDAILPRTSQEQQHHSKLPKDCFRSLNNHHNSTGTHQNPTGRDDYLLYRTTGGRRPSANWEALSHLGARWEMF